MTTGYSGKSLAEKIGIKDNLKIIIINNPGKEFLDEIGDSLKKAELVNELAEDIDMIIFFTKSKNELEKKLSELMKFLKSNGGIWVACPKKSSNVETDVTENVVRDMALPLGLVDIKVCSFTSIWSGLKLVIRKELRKK